MPSTVSLFLPLSLSLSLVPQHHIQSSDHTYLEKFTLVIPRVDRIVVLARTTQQLPPIDCNGRQTQAPIRIHDPGPVLPLHDAARAAGGDGVGDGAVVRFFVVAIASEGVGDACAVGLDQLVVEGVIEALRNACECEWYTWWEGCRGGVRGQ